MPEVHEKLWKHEKIVSTIHPLHPRHHWHQTKYIWAKKVKASKYDLSSGQVDYSSMSHCPILNPENKYLPLKEEIHHAWFIRMIHEWSLEASSPCFTTTSPESYAHLSKLRITRSLAGDAFLKPQKNIAQSGHTFKKKNELSFMVTTWPVFRVLVFLHLHQKNWCSYHVFLGRLLGWKFDQKNTK